MSNKPCQQPSIAEPAHVVVLDDESNVRALFSRWLKAAGYACTEARDAAELWSHLQRQTVDLVTLDVRMPGESGVDLVYEIHREFPDTAILMLTGVDVTTQAVAALTHGAFGYLIKPVDHEDLLFHVRAGMAQRQRKIGDRTRLRQLEQYAADCGDFALPSPHARTPRPAQAGI